MKSMTCKQLGGACNATFRADTFEEIAQLSRAHGLKMFEAGDQAHISAMKEMQELMKSPELMNKWMLNKKREFGDLPHSVC